MLAKQVVEYLDHNHVDYETIHHAQAFTANETAECAHVPGKQFAKTVVVKVDGKFAMVVLPANIQLNFKKLKRDLKAIHGKDREVELAQEYEFSDKFSDCETGAMPPFGELYHMDTYIADSLTAHNDLVFNGGSHEDLIKMSYEDYWELEHPHILSSE